MNNNVEKLIDSKSPGSCRPCLVEPSSTHASFEKPDRDSVNGRDCGQSLDSI
jgi:hypothetical protein